MSIVTWFLAGVATSAAGGVAFLVTGSVLLAVLAGVIVLAALSHRLV